MKLFKNIRNYFKRIFWSNCLCEFTELHLKDRSDTAWLSGCRFSKFKLYQYTKGKYTK